LAESSWSRLIMLGPAPYLTLSVELSPAPSTLVNKPAACAECDPTALTSWRGSSLRLRERDLRERDLRLLRPSGSASTPWPRVDDVHDETLDIDELSLSIVLIPDHELRDDPPELPRRDLLSRSLEVFSSVCLLCSASAASEPGPNRCEISSEPVGSAPFLASLAFGSSPRRPAAPPGRKVAT